MSDGQELGGRRARDEPGSAEVSERDGAFAYLEGRGVLPIYRIKTEQMPRVVAV